MKKHHYTKQVKSPEHREQRFSLRKFSFGAASILVGSLLFLGPTASAEETTLATAPATEPTTTTLVDAPEATEEAPSEEVAPAEETPVASEATTEEGKSASAAPAKPVTKMYAASNTLPKEPTNNAMPRPENEGQAIPEGTGFRAGNAVLPTDEATNVVGDGKHDESKNLHEQGYIAPGVVTNPDMTDPNGAVLTAKPTDNTIATTYNIEKRADSVTFAVVDLTSYKEGHSGNWQGEKGNYYLTLSIARSNPEEVLIRLINQDTNSLLGETIVNRTTTEEIPTNGLPRLVRGAENTQYYMNVKVLKDSNGYKIKFRNQADGLASAHTIKYKLLSSSSIGKDVDLSDILIPDVQNNISYYEEISKETYNTYKETGELKLKKDEPVLAKYVLTGIDLDDFRGSDRREIEGYDYVTGEVRKGELSAVYPIGFYQERRVDPKGKISSVRRVIVDRDNGSGHVEIWGYFIDGEPAKAPGDDKDETTPDARPPKDGNQDGNWKIVYTTRILNPEQLDDTKTSPDGFKYDQYGAGTNATVFKYQPPNPHGAGLQWTLKNLFTPLIGHTHHYYVKQGTVLVNYEVAETGEELGETFKYFKNDRSSAPRDTEYDTVNDDIRLPKIETADGRVFELLPTNEVKTGSDDVRGVVESGKDKVITYLYREVKGDVKVHYVIQDEDTKLQDSKTVTFTEDGEQDKDATHVSTSNQKDYNTNVDYLKPTEIRKETEHGEAIYKLVDVRNNEAKGDKPEAGKVVAGETQHITYEYKEVTGNVNVNYVIQGTDTVLKEKVAVKTDASNDTPYDTNTDALKPQRLESADGKVYELVDVRNNPAKNDAPAAGKVVAEETKEVTYEYREVKGGVDVNYVLEGTDTVIKDPQTVKFNDDSEQSPTGTKDEASNGTAYNTDTHTLKPTTIKTDDGKVYELVKARANDGDADPAGDVEAGKVKKVTYEYREVKGNVNVNYVIKGTTTVIKNPQVVKADESNDAPYDTNTDDLKPAEITDQDGKKYRLVAVRANKGDAPADGKVVAGETLEVTYEYEEITGDVNVNYVIKDTDTVIKDKQAVVVKGSEGDDYNTDTPTFKPERIEKDGKVYKLVDVRANEGDAPAAGDVVAGETKEVTYEYVEEKGNVKVNYVIEGTETVIKDPQDVKTDASNNEPYTTNTDELKPNRIEKYGKVYELVSVRSNDGDAPASGKVIAGETQNVTYEYREVKGNVNVNYVIVDTDTVIKDKQSVVANGSNGEDYNTNTEDLKPAQIVKDGKVYELVDVRNNAEKGDSPAAGEVVAGKTLEVTYEYREVQGNVVVKFVNEAGEEIKDQEPDTTNASNGTVYSTADKKVPTIEKDGKVYTFKEIQTGQPGNEPEEGTVTAGTTKVVTYVYSEVKGNVNVNYVIEGTDTVISPKKSVVADASNGTAYETNTPELKPDRIEAEDGKVYELVAVRNNVEKGDSPAAGEVVAGKTLEVTYEYREIKGNVIVYYIDEEGNVLKDPVKDTENGSNGQPYDTSELRDKEIKTPDGKVYKFKEVAPNDEPEKGTVTGGEDKDVTYIYSEVKGSVNVNYVLEGTDTVISPKQSVVVDASNDTDYTTDNLQFKPERIETEDGKVYDLVAVRNNNGDAPATGKVVAGQTLEVTYEYREVKGSVNVNYVIEGTDTVIKPKQSVVADASNKTAYNTDTPEFKPERIEATDGKIYELVAVRNNEAKGDSPAAGEVEAGETLEVTYEYREVKGNVIVNYVDEQGNPLKDPAKDTENGSNNEPYNTTDLKDKEIKTPDGKEYVFKEWKEDSDPEKGTVEGGKDKEVTYVYTEKPKGDVVVRYVDIDGNELQDQKEDTPLSYVGKDYDTSDLRDREITKDGKTYVLVPTLTKGTENGKVVEGTTVITYVYKEVVPDAVTGSVEVNYINEEGKVIKPKAPVVLDEAPDTQYDASTEQFKPNRITDAEDGKLYEFVRTREDEGDSPATGAVVANETQQVTHVYREVKGNVIVNYVDEEGNPLKDPAKDTENGSNNEPYNTTELKDKEIKTPDGKEYVFKEWKEDSDPEKGTVEGGKDKEVTYVYTEKPKGDVVVRYVDIDGNELQDQKEDTPLSYVGKDYDTTDLKDPEITKDGKTYVLVPTLTKGTENGKVTEGTTVITYVYKEVVTPPAKVPQRATIEYILRELDGTEKPAPVDSTVTNENDEGEPGEGIAFPNYQPNLTDLIKKGYEVVEDDFNGNRLFDNDTTTDQAFKVVVTPKLTPFTPEDPGKPGEPIDPKNPEGPKWPENPDVLKDALTKTVTRTITYVKKDSLDATEETEAAPSSTNSVTYERTGVINNVTKEVTFNPWTAKGDDKVLEGNPLPFVKGYIAKVVEANYDAPSFDKTTEDITTTPESTNVVEKVVYTPLGSWIPRIPEGFPPAPEVPYPNDPKEDPTKPGTPTDPGVPPIPYVPGHTPEAPSDPNDPNSPKKPLDPVDPNDPTKGYNPPPLPNDPSKDIEITYVKNPVGKVIVHFVDTEGNTLQDDRVDTPDSKVGTDYNTAEENEVPEVIEKDGLRYVRVPSLTRGEENGKVVEGTTEITYVYKKVANWIPLIPGNPKENNPRNPYPFDPKNPDAPTKTPPTTPDGETPNVPYVPGYTPVDPNTPLDPKDPDGPRKPLDPVNPKDPNEGYVPPVPKDPGVDTEIPYLQDGDVIVHYVDTEGNTIKGDVVDTKPSPVGTGYDTTDNKPEVIMVGDTKYVLVPSKTVGSETGKVVSGTTEITYVYQKVANWIPLIPGEPNPPKNPYPFDPKNPDSPIDTPPTTPDGETPNVPYVPGYTPMVPKDPKDPKGPKVPLTPVNPEDPTKGYIPPVPEKPGEDTYIPYVPNTPEPGVKEGNVLVHYEDEDGNPIKSTVVDTPTSKVGTDYDTTDNKPEEIVVGNNRYVLVPSKTRGTENGKVVEGTTEITYVYKRVGNWIPLIPGEPNPPKNPYPFDPENPDKEIPQEPNNPGGTPNVPHVPGYIPNGPDGEPLTPVDPKDPNKGYVPPKPKVPGEDTYIPYVPAGNVVIEYRDTEGNPLKDPMVDTPLSKVGTDYNTAENENERPNELFDKDGNRYVRVPSLTRGDENGKVVQGTTTIVYVYKKVANWIPKLPNKPMEEWPKNPYPFDPERPNDPIPTPPNNPGGTPNVPYVPGYTPFDPKDPNDPNDDVPLVPVDPENPEKGYIPPVPNVPGEDTYIPYVPNKPEPGKPSEPGTPDKPETPKPGKPVEPGTPDKPETPKPGKPVEPGTPDKPETPTTPAPEKPSEPGTPTKLEKLPETGDASAVGAGAFGIASILASLGLVAPRRRKKD